MTLFISRQQCFLSDVIFIPPHLVCIWYPCLFQEKVEEPLGSMKPRLKEERDEGEEPDRKKVKTEEAKTVEMELESHPQVHKVDMF